MASPSVLRRSIAEVSRRLVALLEESLTPAGAVRILVAEKILPPGQDIASAYPLSAAINSVVSRSGKSHGAAQPIVAYVGACEAQGRGDSALRLLGRLKIRRASGRTSLGLIGVEFVLLMIVLLIHSIFVLPQIQQVFASVDTPMPAFTQMIFALIGPSSPFIYVVFFLLLVLLIWRIFPFAFGPLLAPFDRLLMSLPLIGSATRKSNSDRLSGWLGFADADASSQLAAIDAARVWYRGDVLSRQCGAVLREVAAGKELSACLAEANGFDREFQAVISIPEREDSLAALRARWRIADTLPEQSSSLAPALVQIALGVIVAAVVIAMYLPLFKLGSLVG